MVLGARPKWVLIWEKELITREAYLCTTEILQLRLLIKL